MSMVKALQLKDARELLAAHEAGVWQVVRYDQ